MVDFDKIYLTRNEKKHLNKIKHSQPVPENQIGEPCDYFREIHLIEDVYDGSIDDIGQDIPSGKIQLSEDGEHFYAYRRERAFERKIPVMISIGALASAIASIIISIFSSLT